MTRSLSMIAVVCAAWACSSTLRVPPSGSPPTIDPSFKPVDYPPPPARVENVGRDPGAPCVWQDGYWTWSGRRWEWTSGKWVRPPEACYYVEPRLLYPQTEGQQVLLYAPPAWFREFNGTVSPCAEPPRCPSK